MKRSICNLLLICLVLNLDALSQNREIIEEYDPNINLVFNTPNVIYYGIDFSMMKLTNLAKIGQDKELRRFMGAWITRFEDEIPPQKYISRWIRKKEGFTYEPNEIQKRFELVPEIWITYEDYSFNLEALKDVINSYELKETDGLGFVVNIENFNKRGEFVSAYFTFFDIKTKEIYWATKARAEPDGWGMTRYWAGGILNVFKLFINEEYKKKYNLWK